MKESMSEGEHTLAHIGDSKCARHTLPIYGISDYEC